MPNNLIVLARHASLACVLAALSALVLAQPQQPQTASQPVAVPTPAAPAVMAVVPLPLKSAEQQQIERLSIETTLLKAQLDKAQAENALLKAQSESSALRKTPGSGNMTASRPTVTGIDMFAGRYSATFDLDGQSYTRRVGQTLPNGWRIEHIGQGVVRLCEGKRCYNASVNADAMSSATSAVPAGQNAGSLPGLPGMPPTGIGR